MQLTISDCGSQKSSSSAHSASISTPTHRILTELPLNLFKERLLPRTMRLNYSLP
ncbi:MAG: hypothetical protein H5T33_01940 [Candidatus Methanosuratus sp.]|nr:hypothetical protein [Candidatus Methanosuratincola sp.]